MKVDYLAMAALAVVLLIPCIATADTEIIIDNPNASLVGEWETGTMTLTRYGDDYYYCFVMTGGGSSATYTPSIPTTASNWQVYTWYPAGSNRPTQARYIVHHAGGDSTVYVNQQTNGGMWFGIGTYSLNAGTSNYVRITNQGTETTKVVMADAVRFLLAGTPDTTPPVISNVSASPGSITANITWTTDEPATSQVEYGETTSYGSETTKDNSLVTNHSVLVAGLEPSTLYHFRVRSEDASANPAVSGDETFTTTAGVSGETRAVWVNTWNDGILSASQITSLVNTTSGANYNVIIPEIRKCGDAYYDSAYEPRASNIIDPPPFDPLQDLINKAHAQNMKVYAWLVTYRIWNSSWGAAPAYHIWTQHPEWAMKKSNGSIQEGTLYNLDPGIPAVQDYICKVVCDLASKYDIDGINWDYVRYPDNTWGYNDITRQRFYDEYGYYPPTSDNGAQWDAWSEYRRQQVTDLVKKCHLELMAINAQINHTVCTVGWMGADPNTDYEDTRQYADALQDARKWMQDHIIDTNILMNYKREHDAAQAADYDLWTNWLASMQISTGRYSVDGQACYLNTIANSIHQMQVARNAGIGLCNYDYRSTNNESKPASDFYDAVRTNLYQSPADPPEMAWKTAPTTGTIFGTVTDASDPNDPIYQDWIYKASVTVTGPVTRNTQTDATGTYGFLDLPPGTYDITVSKTGFPTRTYTGQVLTAGQMLREDFDLGYVTAGSPTGTVANGWSLISVPYEPVNPDPASVFAGIDIDGMLYRWDNPTQGLYLYDVWSPEQFGSVNISDGYWLQSFSADTISYQAKGGAAAQRAIPLPTAGWAIIGCPFQTAMEWGDTAVKNGGQTLSLQSARDSGWMSSTGYWWDAGTQGLMDLGLEDDFIDYNVLEPWHGYWVQTYVNGLTLTLQ